MIVDLKKETALALKYHFDSLDNAKNAARGWIACGVCLLKIKEALPHGAFAKHIKEQCPFDSRQARKYITFAKQSQALLELVKKEGALSMNEALKLLPAKNKEQLAYVGSLEPTKGRDANNWHTPADIIDSAKKVMGEIDLDPFSDEEANKRIKASKIYTEEEDALYKDWDKVKTVFVNPPYGQGIITKAIKKLIEEYQEGKFEECILLVNNATDTHWFHSLRPFVSAICFTEGRIAFLSPAKDGVLKEVSANTRGQVFFYFGKNAKAFIAEYKGMGWTFEVNNEK